MSDRLSSVTHSAVGPLPSAPASTLARYHLGRLQRFGKRRRVALVGRVQQLARRPPPRGVQIHRVLGLVGQMRRAEPSSWRSWPRARVAQAETQSSLESFLPLRLRSSSETRQVLGRGRLDAALPGQVLEHLPVAFTRVAPHDVAQRRVRPPWSRSSTPMRSPLTRPASPPGRPEPMVEDRRVDFMGQARAGLRQPGMVRQEWARAQAPQWQEAPAASGCRATPLQSALSRCPRSARSHAEIAPGRHRGARLDPGRVRSRRPRRGKGVEAALTQHRPRTAGGRRKTR